MPSTAGSHTDLEISTDTPNLYRVLQLDPKEDNTASAVRAAYKQALLVHHPDKKASHDQTTAVTIDTISLAYRVLSDPVLKHEYDQALLTAGSDENVPDKFTVFRTGLENVDLDDLAYDEVSSIWTRACRCGSGGGYTVTELELEKHAEEGELVTGCRGCSLWIRVLFSVD